MKMNKILVKLYVPMIEAQYDIFIPANRKIYNVIKLLAKAVFELSGGNYRPEEMPYLYDKLTAKAYDVNISVKESTIRNGTEVILI